MTVIVEIVPQLLLIRFIVSQVAQPFQRRNVSKLLGLLLGQLHLALPLLRGHFLLDDKMDRDDRQSQVD